MSKTIMEEIEFLRGQLIIVKVKNPSQAQSFERAMEHEIARLEKERGQEVFCFVEHPCPTYILKGEWVE